MTIAQRFHKVINRLRHVHEYRLIRKSQRVSLSNALARWRHCDVRTVIDIGASDGCWSKRAMRDFPHADYLLIEAQPQVHGDALREFKARHANVDIVLAAAGARQGSIYFDASNPLGGIASDTPFEQHCIEVPVTTVDAEIAARGLKPPYLLKLDTHGFEVPIFEGATRTLEQTSLLIVEVYNFQLTSESLRFPQLCAYLEERGMRCVDLFDILHRPSDKAMWQFDLVFVPETQVDYQDCHYP